MGNIMISVLIGLRCRIPGGGGGTNDNVMQCNKASAIWKRHIINSIFYFIILCKCLFRKQNKVQNVGKRY